MIFEHVFIGLPSNGYENRSEVRDFQPKRWGFLQTLLKIEVGNHKKDEHGTQVSRYDFLKGIFEQKYAIKHSQNSTALMLVESSLKLSF
jgi:hypothetical protein